MRDQASGKQLVELVMSADPNPDNRVTAAFSDGLILLIDSHRPDVLAGPKLLEAQRGVARIIQEQPISAARRLANAWV
jgi:hypothetical protein